MCKCAHSTLVRVRCIRVLVAESKEYVREKAVLLRLFVVALVYFLKESSSTLLSLAYCCTDTGKRQAFLHRSGQLVWHDIGGTQFVTD